MISKNAHIGEYCRIHVGVNIGENVEVGDRVYIGPGVKIFNHSKVADDIAIGANAIVNKSFNEPGISIAGIPAKKISDKDSSRLLYTGRRNS